MTTSAEHWSKFATLLHEKILEWDENTQTNTERCYFKELQHKCLVLFRFNICIIILYFWTQLN